MSIIHSLITSDLCAADVLLLFMGENYGDVKCEIRSEDVWYFYIKNESARGVDFSKEDYGYEIRNTIMSNEADYRLAAALAKYSAIFTKGRIRNEDGKYVNPEQIFSKEDIKSNLQNDARMIQILSGQKEEIKIFGPEGGSVYFGTKTHQMFKPYENDPAMLADKMNQLIMNVLYGLPATEGDTIMEVQGKNGGKDLILKVISRNNKYVIKKYDYIILTTENQDKNGLLMITNELLNTILPDEWELVDEFTIVAPSLSEASWNKLISRAQPLNQLNNFSELRNK